jgi:erythronate-4-phosphate dehydrogenase
MKVFADENIPFAREAFGQFGDVVTYKGRDLTPQRIAEADILFVRSVTKVGPQLLDASQVKFVATATIGTDHVDEAYLAKRGIGFASAPGSNANSVAEYITAALLELSASVLQRKVEGMTIGIVGVGNVGSRVEKKARALGMNVLLNDPPLRRQTGDPKYLPLEKLFEADVITMHVPLTKEGGDATYHLANESFFVRMKPGSVFINSSRGPVAKGSALTEALGSKKLAGAVLDVWEGEPNLDAALLERVLIGTPHIAGYSYDGKVNGTKMIHDAACHFFGVETGWSPAPEKLALPQFAFVGLGTQEGEAGLRSAVKLAYDIRADDMAMRRITQLPPAEHGAYFDRLRKQYPVRREFPAVRVWATAEPLRRQLAALGFNAV